MRHLKQICPEDVIVMENNRETVQQGEKSVIDFHSNWSVPTFDGEGEMDGLLTVFMKKTGNPTETQIQFLKKMVPIVQMTRKLLYTTSRVSKACFYGSANGVAKPSCVFEQT